MFRNARIILRLLPIFVLIVPILLMTACAPASLISPLPSAQMRSTAYYRDILVNGKSTLPSLPPGEARIYATQVALPTYPVENYQSAAFDPTYRWPYLRFDRERFRTEAPLPEVRNYELLVLENDYLLVSIMPELGGRIWQVVDKATGDTMFYQNSVVKPSPWGPASQLGWLGLGGLEWALPVNEHGYAWGTTWEVTTFQNEDGSVGVHIATPDDGRLLSAEIDVTLHPQRASVSIAPTIHNLADQPLSFHFWQTAMLAPGPENLVSADLRFVSPSPIMSIHSTGDTMLPGPGMLFTWPNYFGRDMSRLGNWDRYAGFFEYPRAHGPFVGIYDPTLDVGAVRVYPAEISQGSKIFGLGWRNRIGSEDFTDDGSMYVELHGGLSPTFDEPATLAGGESVQWEESWYPLAGIGNMVYANQRAALNLARIADGLRIAIYPTEAISGTLTVLQDEQSGHQRTDNQQKVAEFPLDLLPTIPFVQELHDFAPDADVTIRVSDLNGEILLEYSSGQK